MLLHWFSEYERTPFTHTFGRFFRYYFFSSPGHTHNFRSQAKIDHSYILLLGRSKLFGEDIYVDPRLCTNVLARYINDPMEKKNRNCKFVLEPNLIQAKVVASRDITQGEELFISYGECYWAAQPKVGKVIPSKSSQED